MVKFASDDRSALDDQDLIGAAKKGNRDAFSVLIKRYHLQIFNMLYALVGDWDEADDLTQETMVKAYQALGRFEGRAQFYTWLYRIGINCWKDWCKTPRKQREVGDVLDDGQSLFDQYAAPEITDAQVQRTELQEMLKLALSKLPEEYRAALVLREIDGLGYDEIADVLDCSLGTVKSRIFRGRTQLKKMWEVHYRQHWEGSGANNRRVVMG